MSKADTYLDEMTADAHRHGYASITADALESIRAELAASRAQCERLEQSLADAKAEASARDAKVATLREALEDMLTAMRQCGYYEPGTMGQAVRAARAALAATSPEGGAR